MFSVCNFVLVLVLIGVMMMMYTKHASLLELPMGISTKPAKIRSVSNLRLHAVMTTAPHNLSLVQVAALHSWLRVYRNATLTLHVTCSTPGELRLD